MPTLFDILAQAQNGNGMQALAQQYGLSMQQTQAAVAALLPAFSQGLQRSTADPYGLGAFMTAMASGQHAKYFEDATRAFSPQGINEGNGILGHLFGSKDLSRAVAAQAAQATGLSQQVLQQMLPAMASMMMGGLFKQTTNQMQAAGGFGGGGNPLGEIIEQMMRQAGGGAQPAPQPAPNPYGENPLGKVLQDMFGGALPGGQPAQQPQARQQNQAPQPQTNPSGRPKNPFDDLFGKMFETGAQQRDEYQKGMETIFDQFRKGMDRR